MLNPPLSFTATLPRGFVIHGHSRHVLPCLTLLVYRLFHAIHRERAGFFDGASQSQAPIIFPLFARGYTILCQSFTNGGLEVSFHGRGKNMGERWDASIIHCTQGFKNDFPFYSHREPAGRIIRLYPPFCFLFDSIPHLRVDKTGALPREELRDKTEKKPNGKQKFGRSRDWAIRKSFFPKIDCGDIVCSFGFQSTGYWLC
jgi:hypothetical protein